MHKIAFVLTCFVWSVHGRRVNQASGRANLNDTPIPQNQRPSSYELGVHSGSVSEEAWQMELMDSLKEALEIGTSQVTILFSMKACPWCEQMLAVVEEAVESRATVEPAVSPHGADMLKAPLRVFVLDADDFPSVAAQFGAKLFPTTVVFGRPDTTPVMAHGYLSEEHFDEMLRVAVLGRSAAVMGTFQEEESAPSPQSLVEVKQEKSAKGKFNPKKAFADFLHALNPASASSKVASHELGSPAQAAKKGWQEEFMGRINNAIHDGTSQVAIIFSMHGCHWCEKMYTVAEEVVNERADAASSDASEDEPALLSAPLRVFILYAEEFPGAAQQFDVSGFPTIVAFGPQGAVKHAGYLPEDRFQEMLSVAIVGIPEEDAEETDAAAEGEDAEGGGDEEESSEEAGTEEKSSE